MQKTNQNASCHHGLVWHKINIYTSGNPKIMIQVLFQITLPASKSKNKCLGLQIYRQDGKGLQLKTFIALSLGNLTITRKFT